MCLLRPHNRNLAPRSRKRRVAGVLTGVGTGGRVPGVLTGVGTGGRVAGVLTGVGTGGRVADVLTGVGTGVGGVGGVCEELEELPVDDDIKNEAGIRARWITEPRLCCNTDSTNNCKV